jgi:hypothetical protein
VFQQDFGYGQGFTLLGDLRSLFEWQSLGVLSLGGYTIKVLDATGLAGWLLWNMIGPAGLALVIVFVFFVFRLVLRNTWAAAAVYVALFGGLSLAGPDPLPATVLAVVVLS